MSKVHLCLHENDLCDQYAAVARYAQGDELSRGLAHLETFRHCRKPCRHGRTCYHFTRQQDQLREQYIQSEQAKRDKAHCLIYHHVEDMTNFENPAFQTFQAIPRPRNLPLPRGGNVRGEARLNGFADVFTTPAGHLWSIVVTKYGHPIHISLGKPLMKEEILALLLYTGSAIQSDFNESHRKGDFHKWKFLRHYLLAAVKKLHGARTLKYVWRYQMDIDARFAGERVGDNILRTYNQANPMQNHTGCTFTYVGWPNHTVCEYPSMPRAIVQMGNQEYMAERVPVRTFLDAKRAEEPPSRLDQLVQFPQEDMPKFLWRALKKTRFAGCTAKSFDYYDCLSTSKSRRVAENGAFLGRGKDQGILLKLEWDATAIGADVSFISKHAHEEEILFAPTTWQLGEEGICHAEYDVANCLVGHYKLSGLLGV